MSNIADGGSVLTALVLCGLMGMVGQGARAAVGLKKSDSLGGAETDGQAEFSAAYFGLSLMIGFIAGIVAGLVANLKNFTQIDLDDPKLLLGIAISGYAGADFIENSLSIFIPASSTPAPVQTLVSPPTAQTSLALTGPIPPIAAPPAPGNVPASSIQAALSVVLPSVSATTWTPALVAGFARYDLHNARRVAAAIGQFAVEAGAGFQELAENLNYTHADRIHAVFPNEFPTVESALAYVGNPQKLANRVYAGRLGNGDEASGDGWRFRGRGLIQLTGRDEYEEFGSTIGKDADEVSDYCETTEGAAMSGCWYLASRGCLSLADVWNLSAITKKVNGSAMRGNAQRIAYSTDFLKHLGGS